MKQNPIKTRVLEYVLQHTAEDGSYPSSKHISEALGIGISTTQYYLKCLRDDGLINGLPKKTKDDKERPGEDLVYNYITEFEQAHGMYPGVDVISVSLNRDKKTVQRHIVEMIRSGRLENKGDFYRLIQLSYKDSLRSQSADIKANAGIWPSEIRKAKKKIEVGDTVLIRDFRFCDEETGMHGKAVRAQVLSKHRRVVRLSHRLSCTYAQLAKWYRDRRVAIE